MACPPVRPLAVLLLSVACAPSPPRVAPAASAGPLSPGAAAVALAAAADSASPCAPESQVAEVHNPLGERAFVSITTSAGQVFYVDTPLAADEVRRLKLPGRARAVRADAASEPWRVAPRERLTTAQQVRQDGAATSRSQVTTRIPVRMACAT